VRARSRRVFALVSGMVVGVVLGLLRPRRVAGAPRPPALAGTSTGR
jgi:xanthosine utilization system XapX-like protein